MWLYDTFAGMSEPDDRDVRAFDGRQAIPDWKGQQRSNGNTWNYADVDEVKANLYSTGYPKENLKFIKGKVEDTLPSQMPN